MKSTFLFLGILISFISCNKSDSPSDFKNLVGKWKLTEVISHDGANGDTTIVPDEESFFMYFTNTNYNIPTFTEDCHEGLYNVLDNLLVLHPNGICDTIEINYSLIDNSTLSLQLVNDNCDEFCLSIFNKIE